LVSKEGGCCERGKERENVRGKKKSRSFEPQSKGAKKKEPTSKGEETGGKSRVHGRKTPSGKKDHRGGLGSQVREEDDRKNNSKTVIRTETKLPRKLDPREKRGRNLMKREWPLNDILKNDRRGTTTREKSIRLGDYRGE